MKKNVLLALLFFLACFIAQSQWSDDPQLNLQLTGFTTEAVIPKIAVGPNGDYFLGYFVNESSNYNVYLQRLDHAGNILWQDNGILISDHPSMSWLTDWDLTVDNDNHAVLTFMDVRENGNTNIVAYRISPDGGFVWGENGLMLSAGESFEASPKVIITDANNAVVAWQCQELIKMQKITPEGQKPWGEWGLTFSSQNSCTWPQLLAVGQDDFIMKYYEDSGTAWAPVRNLFAQRFDTNGSPVWEQAVVISNQGSITAWTQILPFVNDGEDGFYIAWHDNAISGTISSAWLQHVDAQGQIVFPENGVLLSDRHDFNQFTPQLASPENDASVFVYWNEVDAPQNSFGIYGQKVSAQGQLEWGTGGKEIYPLGSSAMIPLLAQPYQEDVVLVFRENTSLLKAVRLNADGINVWENEESVISSSGGSKGHFTSAGFSENQWVFAWEENGNISGQNLYTDGSIGQDVMEYFTLSVTIEGNGQVEVQNVLYEQPLTVEEGAQLDLEALAADGWEFESWSGDHESENSQISIVMDSDKNLIAGFVESSPVLYDLSVNINPVQGGTVEGEGQYQEGHTVNLAATASPDFVFVNWTNTNGEEISEDAEFDFMMPASDITLTANFQSTVSVSPINRDEIKVYPNPVSGTLHIYSDSPVDKVLISDITGKTIMVIKGDGANEVVKDAGQLKNGIYFLKLTTETSIEVKKIQVVR